MKESKSQEHSKENLFELCLNGYISMKLLFTYTSDIVPVSSKKFENYGVYIHSETRTWHNKNIQLLLIALLQKVQSTTDKKEVK